MGTILYFFANYSLAASVLLYGRLEAVSEINKKIFIIKFKQQYNESPTKITAINRKFSSF